MTCREIKELLCLSAWKRTGEEEESALRSHLAGCTSCRAQLEELRAMRDAVAAELKSMRMPEEVKQHLIAARQRVETTYAEIAENGFRLVEESMRVAFQCLAYSCRLAFRVSNSH